MAKQPNYWLISLLAMLLSQAVLFGLILASTSKFVPTPEEIVEEITIASPEYFDFFTQGIDDLANSLKDEQEKLSERERLIREQEKQLMLEKDEIKRIKDEIASYKDELGEKVFTLEESEEKNLKSLATTYSNISPEAAVNIFDEMDDVFVVKILSYMPTDAVAPIFQEMSKGPKSERVARFSDMIRLKTDNKKDKK